MTILGEIKIKRDYYYSDKFKKGFYPIERENPLLKDYCFPYVKELICYTSCLNPYDLTQEILEKLSNIKISTSQIQKVTNSIGNELIKEEEDLINKPFEYKKSDKKVDKMVISMDGAMVNTYDGWKEVKTGVVYEIKGNKTKPKSINKSYVSKIEDNHSFRKRIKTEARRRKYFDAKEVVVIGDGARWIWDLAEKEFPSSIKILDWYHAKEHLHNIVNLLYPNDNPEKLFLSKTLEDMMYEGNISDFLNLIYEKKQKTDIIDRLDDLMLLQREEEYFSKNRQKMQYKHFEEKEYPI